jgi:hypothetical protein
MPHTPYPRVGFFSDFLRHNSSVLVRARLQPCRDAANWPAALAAEGFSQRELQLPTRVSHTSFLRVAFFAIRVANSRLIELPTILENPAPEARHLFRASTVPLTNPPQSRHANLNTHFPTTIDLSCSVLTYSAKLRIRTSVTPGASPFNTFNNGSQIGMYPRPAGACPVPCLKIVRTLSAG